MSAKNRSVKTAVLKTLSNQYSSFYDMHKQALELSNQFNLEVQEILQIIFSNIHSNSTAVHEATGPISTAVTNSSEQTQETKDASEPKAKKAVDLQFDVPENENQPWLKKLFKKIALQCHPDKVSVNDHRKMLSYILARQALDEENEALMISIGAEYNQFPDIPHQEIKQILKKNISVLNSELNALHSSAAWAWGMSEDNFDVKVNILIQAAAQFYNRKLSRAQIAPSLRTYFGYNRNGTEKRKIGEKPKRIVRKK